MQPAEAAVSIEHQADGVLVVRISGLLTARGLLGCKEKILTADLGGRAVKSFAVDYRRAILALDGPSLDAILEGERRGDMPALPAAMAVPPAAEDLFVGHAVRMANRCITRQVFVEWAPALQWAQRHAARWTATR